MTSKSHYTAKELARLPGMPTTEQGVIEQIKRGTLASVPRKKADGSDSKFRIVPLEALPPATRKELARKNVSAVFGDKIVDIAAARAANEAAAETSEAERLRAREQSLKNFSRLPEWQQRAARAKLQIIKSCELFITTHGCAKTQGQELFCYEYSIGSIDIAPGVRAHYRDVSAATLRRWIDAEHQLGIMGLVDMYGNRKGQGKIGSNQQLKTAVEALILDKPHIKPHIVRTILVSMFPGEEIPSAKTVERYLEQWKAANHREFLVNTNPDKAKGTLQPAHGSQSEAITAFNQEWQFDGTPADVMLTDGRHTVIGKIDVFSRRMKLLVSKTSKSVMVANLFRRCVLEDGIPASVRTDNGKDYTAEYFERVLDDLETQHILCAPFASDEKGHIERALGTFSHDLVELLDGYIGHSVADRKVIESRKSFAKRLGDPDNVIHVSLDSAAFQKFCDDWCAMYNERVHSSLGMSPNAKAATCRSTSRRISDERALDVLLYEAPPRRGKLPTIQKKGIKLDHGWYTDPALAIHTGKVARVLYDPEDLGQIVVYLPNEHGVFQFLCIAKDYDRLGISRTEAANVAKAIAKRHDAELRQVAKEKKKAIKGVDLVAAVLQERRREAEDAAGNVAHFPRPSVPYTTPGLQAAAEAADALQGRNLPAEHAADVAASRDRLQARMAAPAPSKVFEIPHDPAAKYRKWCELDGLIGGGVAVSDDEQRFYEAFRGSRTWRSFKGVEEEIDYSLRGGN